MVTLEQRISDLEQQKRQVKKWRTYAIWQAERGDIKAFHELKRLADLKKSLTKEITALRRLLAESG